MAFLIILSLDILLTTLSPAATQSTPRATSLQVSQLLNALIQTLNMRSQATG